MNNCNNSKKLYPKALVNANLADFLPVLDNYFRDIPRTIKRKATVDTCDFVEKYMSTVKWVENRWKALDKAIDTVSIINGIWMELGIYSGQTITYIAKRAPKEKIYGLDSFKGLPETWRPEYQKGDFATSSRPNPPNNVIIVEGYFNKTLPEILKKDKRKIAFLHVDCDLYSSSKTAFEYLCKRIVPGSVLVFDEFFNYPGWRNHEFRAFNELVKDNNFKFKFLTYVRNHSQVVIQFI